MISFFKKYFLPNSSNNHRPHFLHRKAIFAFVIVLLLAEVGFFFLPTNALKHDNSNLVGAVLPGVLDSLTNIQRESFALNNLTESPLLDKAAQLKAEDMATKGYFAHNSPEGITSWYWFQKVGYNYDYAGENLAINFVDSKDVSDAWMNSPTHRSNLLKSTYTEIGTGMAVGMYEGQSTIFVVQLYGTPKKQVVSTLQTPKPVVGSSKSAPKPIIVKVSKEPVSSTTNVLGATSINETSSVVENIITSPHQSTNKVLFIAFTIVSLALLLKIFLRRRHYHHDLLVNGVVALAFIASLYLINDYLSTNNAAIGRGLDASPLSFIDTKSRIS